MNNLTIVGLGPGSKSFLTIEALDVLKSAEVVYVRTEKHPVMAYLSDQGVNFESFDGCYEVGDTFEAVYDAIVANVIELLKTKNVVYAVPGNPFVAESTVEKLMTQVDSDLIKIVHGASFIDAIVTTLHIDPVYGLKIMDGLVIDKMLPDVTSDALIIQVYDQTVASNVKIKLMHYYDDDQEVVVVRGAGIEGEEVILRVPLYEMDRVDCLDHLTSVYIKAVSPTERKKFFLEDLIQIMTELRSPEGCPWDREQTHESLKRYLIEEAYEVVDAINEDDLWGLEEELGDLLLQVIFHAEIASENGYFNMTDVITGIYEKMIRRHPHVFSDVSVENSDEVLDNWEVIKNDEKDAETVTESIDHIAKSLPPILRAEKIMKKIAKAGFDYPDVNGSMLKVIEEQKELEHALENGDMNHAFDELGDLLFAVIDVARKLKMDPSEALSRTCEKVIDRFAYVEENILAENTTLSEVSLEKMDKLWQKAKKHNF